MRNASPKQITLIAAAFEPHNSESYLVPVSLLRTVLYTRGVTKRCRLSLLTNSALVIRVQMRGEEGVAGSQQMRTAVHIT
jgi:hypothetical protein